MYQAFAAEMLLDVEEGMRVPGGWAGVRSVLRDGLTGRMPLEDIQPSYWLAETALYLYLLFANDTILQASPSTRHAGCALKAGGINKHKHSTDQGCTLDELP